MTFSTGLSSNRNSNNIKTQIFGFIEKLQPGLLPIRISGEGRKGRILFQSQKKFGTTTFDDLFYLKSKKVVEIFVEYSIMF